MSAKLTGGVSCVISIIATTLPQSKIGEADFCQLPQRGSQGAGAYFQTMTLSSVFLYFNASAEK
jgi:hypothetical protein